LNATVVEETVGSNKQGVGTIASDGGEGSLDLSAGSRIVDLNLKSTRAGSVW
jgi:hypothetical protein